MVFAQLGGIATCSFADSVARIRGSFAGLHRWACLALGFHSIDACTLETHVETDVMATYFVLLVTQWGEGFGLSCLPNNKGSMCGDHALSRLDDTPMAVVLQ